MPVSKDLIEYVKTFGNMTEEKALEWICANCPNYSKGE